MQRSRFSCEHAMGQRCFAINATNAIDAPLVDQRQSGSIPFQAPKFCPDVAPGVKTAQISPPAPTSTAIVSEAKKAADKEHAFKEYILPVSPITYCVWQIHRLWRNKNE